MPLSPKPGCDPKPECDPKPGCNPTSWLASCTSSVASCTSSLASHTSSRASHASLLTGDRETLVGKRNGDLTVLQEQAVKDAAWCLNFAMYWRYWLDCVAPELHRPHDMADGFSVSSHLLTRETFLDIINMCECRILLVKLYRDKGIPYRIRGDRISSRFSEYIFQYARMHETNSPLFGVLGFKRHLSHFLLHAEMAAKAGWKMPKSKRGVPDGIQRVDLAANAIPFGSWHLHDERIIEILNEEGRSVMWCVP